MGKAYWTIKRGEDSFTKEEGEKMRQEIEKYREDVFTQIKTNGNGLSTDELIRKLNADDQASEYLVTVALFLLETDGDIYYKDSEWHKN